MKFSLVRKLVLGILTVAIVTYSTSALFIFKLKPLLVPNMKEGIYITIVLGLGIAWTSFLGWIAAQLIIRPLIRLTHVVDTVATGNLNTSIPVYHAKDEIGMLYHTFNIMLNNLREMITDISNSVAVTEHSADTLKTAIAQATEQIETISITSEQMANSASVQAGSAQTMQHTAELSTETANQMNKEADHAINIAETMVHTITDSAAQMNLLVDGMLHISETSEKTLDIVRKLELEANQIGQISLLVSQIADQTQLLALNASIEASHAGERGLGFAVVAQHIRELAADSASAGEQINRLVGQMQKQTLNVVTETDTQMKLIRSETSTGERAKLTLEEVISSANETARALQNIVQHITIQTGQINDTFKKSQSISNASFTISDGASHISNATQEQTAVMQEIAASSELLRNEAQSLKQKSTAFRL